MTRRALIAMALFGMMAVSPLRASGDEHRPVEMGILLTLSRSSADPSRAWLVVRGVAPGTPAERAGLHAGDLIVGIGGQPITFKNDLEMILAIGRLEPGKPVHLTVVRDRKRQDVELVPKRMTDAHYEQWKADLAALQARTRAGSTP